MHVVSRESAFYFGATFNGVDTMPVIAFAQSSNLDLHTSFVNSQLPKGADSRVTIILYRKEAVTSFDELL